MQIKNTIPPWPKASSAQPKNKKRSASPKQKNFVCRSSDFRSIADALAYAELLRLAPELLDDYLSDAKTLKEVLERLKKKVAKAKNKKAKRPL